MFLCAVYRLTGANTEKYSLKFSSLPNLWQTRPQAALAQLVEHSIRNRKVVGSNPTGGSNEINHLGTRLLWLHQRTHFREQKKPEYVLCNPAILEQRFSFLYRLKRSTQFQGAFVLVLVVWAETVKIFLTSARQKIVPIVLCSVVRSSAIKDDMNDKR